MTSKPKYATKKIHVRVLDAFGAELTYTYFWCHPVEAESHFKGENKVFYASTHPNAPYTIVFTDTDGEIARHERTGQRPL